MTGVDHAAVAKAIYDACRQGTVSIRETVTIKSLQESVPLGPAVAFYAGTEMDRDDSLTTYSYRIPIVAKCAAASYQDCLNVAQDVKDAYHYWGYHNHFRVTTYSPAVLVTANSITLSSSPLYIKNRTYFSPSTISPFVCTSNYTIGINYGVPVAVAPATTIAANYLQYTPTVSIPSSGYWEAFVCVDTTGASSFLGVRLSLDNDSLGYLDIYVNGQISLNTTYLVGSHVTGSWHHYKLAHNMSGSFVEVYMDGSKVASYINLYMSPFSQSFRISNTDTGIIYYVAYPYLSWASSLGLNDNMWCNFTMGSIPSTASIHNASLIYQTSSIAEVDGSVQCNGITGSVGSFATVSELNAYSFTTAQLDDQAVTTGANSLTVTTLVQELVTASQFITSSNYMGFKITPESNPLAMTVASPSLLLEYSTISSPPSRITVQTFGTIEHKNNQWEKTLNLTFLYNGVSKNVS